MKTHRDKYYTHGRLLKMDNKTDVFHKQHENMSAGLCTVKSKSYVFASSVRKSLSLTGWSPMLSTISTVSTWSSLLAASYTVRNNRLFKSWKYLQNNVPVLGKDCWTVTLYWHLCHKRVCLLSKSKIVIIPSWSRSSHWHPPVRPIAGNTNVQKMTRFSAI